MAGESLNFPIFAEDHASKNIREVGDAAASTAAKLDIAAVSAKLWNDTTIKQGRAADTAIAAMKSHANASGLLADAENVLAGKATVTTKLMADQGTAFDNTGKAAQRAAGTTGGGGLAALIGGGGGGGGGMAALITAGVALSPVLLTVGTGLAGFGAAAAGAAAPILAAAGATGGLAANLQTLTPEQRQAAQGLLGLQQQFQGFEKALQPQVLGVFNQGLKLAGNLLADVQPVAQATGTALGGLVGAIDKEFRSQTWQQFFGFMAKTAGPDIKLLQGAFIALLDTLPPLVQGLQPVATSLLTIVKDGSQALDILTHFPGVVTGSGLALDTFHAQATAASGSIKLFSGSTGAAVTAASGGNGALNAFGHTLGFISTLSQGAHLWLGLATGNIKDSGVAAAVAGPKFFSLNQSVAALNKSMTTLVGNLLTLQGGELAWKQSLQAAETQLKSNSAGLEGNSKNALANKQAVLASSQAALSFAQQELATGKNITGASDTVQDQIKWLQGLHDKSQFVKDELHALRQEEQLLQQQKLDQTIHVQGLGQWSVSQSLAPGAGHRRATGGLVPGYGGGDKWPALLEGGEAIVPKHLTPAVAPFLKAQGVPGFASGGLIPSYSGSAAMAPWVKADDKATIGLIDQAVVSATLAGMRAAQSAALAIGRPSGHGGIGGGVQQWANLVLVVLKMLGQPAGDLGTVLSQMTTESGGNPRAINLTDSNAAAGDPSRGLMQVIGTTFNAYAGQFRNRGIYDPLANIYAGLNYAIHRYGAGWTSVLGHGHGYDDGGFLPVGASLAVNRTGQPERVTSPGQETAMLAALGRIEKLLAAAPERTGGALGDALNGRARTSRYSGMYSPRGG